MANAAFLIGLTAVSWLPLIWAWRTPGKPWIWRYVTLAGPIVWIAATAYFFKVVVPRELIDTEVWEATANYTLAYLAIVGMGLLLLLPAYVVERRARHSRWVRALKYIAVGFWLLMVYGLVIHPGVWRFLRICLPPGVQLTTGTCDLPPG